MQVETIAGGVHSIDVNYLGRPGGIAACVLETDAGLVLVDPGPTSSLHGLHAGLASLGMRMADATLLLLTHIHLDHAGAAGTLVAAHPGLRVGVHARGAPHLANPGRLLDSALRIYGGGMDRLFGEVRPVPGHAIDALRGGETLQRGGRTLRIADAPGHAVHHLACLDERSGTVFVGDTAGERFAPAEWVLPVTPPPDIDLEAWHTTLDAIRTMQPDRLFLTHFGPAVDVPDHLDRLARSLDAWAQRVRASLDEPGDDARRAAAFVESVSADIRAHVPAELVPDYLGGGLTDSWYGLARYWRKRAA